MANQSTQALPEICPECGAIESRVRDEETHAPLVAIVCSDCGYIFDWEFPE